MQHLQASYLEHLLSLVPSLGWSNQALSATTKHLGYAPFTEKLVFPGGVSDAISCFHERINQEMHTRLSSHSLPLLRIRERISRILIERLQCMSPYKEAVRALVAHGILHPIESSKMLWKTVDMIWYLAGDQATDINHYTKRLLLSSVYSSSLIYWLRDESDNYSDTESFIQRRIEEVMQLQKIKFPWRSHRSSSHS